MRNRKRKRKNRMRRIRKGRRNRRRSTKRRKKRKRKKMKKKKMTNIIMLTHGICRLFWSKMVTLLSFVINILMLVTWNARASLHDHVIPANATKVPDAIYE